MALSKALNGAVPARMRGSSPNSGGQNRYRIANTFASSIFTGDIVKVSAGYIQPIATTTDFAQGVFMGCEYVYPVSNRPVYGKYWPGGTSSVDAKPYANVVDDPSAIYVMQADATVSIGDVESANFAVTLGSGSTLTGRSGFGIKVATRDTTISQMVRVVGSYDIPGNELGDANPKVLVRIVQHIDAQVSVNSGA